MKRFLVLLILPFITFCSFSQSWNWVTTAGGPESDKANDMDIDAAGNIYVGGYYNSNMGPAIFGSLPVQADFGKEGFLARVDPQGNWIWMRPAIGGWDERVLGIHVDTVNGFIYATGCCWYTTDFGSCFATGSTYPGGADEIFIAKFDLNGNCIWLRGAGGDGDDHGYDMVTDKAGNIYLTGFITDEYFSGTPCYFGALNYTVPMGDSTAFLVKMSPAGTFLWLKTFQAIDGERDNRIAIDSSNNVYVAGGFWGTKNLGMGNVTSYGGVDIFVTKFDQNGNQQWVKTVGSPYSDRANHLTVDPYQHIYVTGEFRDRVGFGLDSLNNNGGPGGRDIFVSKLLPNGTWVWAKKAGDSGGGDRGNRIVSNKNANLFVTGQFKGDSCRFGSSVVLSTTDSIQVFVAAIDTTGKWKWALQGGSIEEDRGNGITCDDSCNVFVCGYYKQPATFGTITTGWYAGRDLFVARIDSGCFTYGAPPPPPEPPPVPTCSITGIPNVLTPNSDNVNDKLWVDKNCLKDIRFTLYNRWGNLLHTSYNPDMLWDGMIHGSPASEGVYYFICEITEMNGDVTVHKGYLTLLSD